MDDANTAHDPLGFPEVNLGSVELGNGPDLGDVLRSSSGLTIATHANSPEKHKRLENLNESPSSIESSELGHPAKGSADTDSLFGSSPPQPETAGMDPSHTQNQETPIWRGRLHRMQELRRRRRGVRPRLTSAQQVRHEAVKLICVILIVLAVFVWFRWPNPTQADATLAPPDNGSVLGLP